MVGQKKWRDMLSVYGNRLKLMVVDEAHTVIQCQALKHIRQFVKQEADPCQEARQPCVFVDPRYRKHRRSDPHHR